ncbi:MAG TPA: glycosyltransferase [Acidimicrobiales bacterium]|nr:glycosyltransferase [Acidimicrobiales bacterium]
MSTLLVATDHHFSIDPNQRVAVRPLIPPTFYDRYRRVFERVIVLGRARRVERIEVEEALLPPEITFVPLPDAHGPRQLLAARPAMRRIVRQSCRSEYAYLLRAPGRVGPIVATELRRRGLGYALEVAGDPATSLAKGSNEAWLRPLYQRLAAWEMRRQLEGAIGVSYVTSQALQRLYPPPPGAFVSSYSSIDLGPEAMAGGPRSYSAPLGAAHLITVASLIQPYKGVDVLIEALRRCQRNGLQLDLTIVGDGPLRGGLQQQAAAAGLGARVTFAGEVPAGRRVRELLDAADLFVLASRDEGLPRALIEAMARGLPAISTSVGGVPELLPAGSLVPPGDPGALAERIGEFLRSPARMTAAAAAGFETARAYGSDVLTARRDGFYRQVRESSHPGEIAP